jgi:hypothetical protein
VDERGDAVSGDGVDLRKVDQDERRGFGEDDRREPLQRLSGGLVERPRLTEQPRSGDASVEHRHGRL